MKIIVLVYVVCLGIRGFGTELGVEPEEAPEVEEETTLQSN